VTVLNTPEELAKGLFRRAESLAAGQQLWVGLGGAPGSGKTTLSNKLAELLGGDAVAACLSMDGFHYTKRQLEAFPDPEDAFRRRGSPPTFDAEGLLKRITEVRRAGSGSFPTFDHAAGDPVADGAAVRPHHRIVLIEGNYLLVGTVEPWRQICALFDVRVYVRCPISVCASRLISRHMHAWGMSAEAAQERIDTNDMINAQFVQEQIIEAECDFIIDNPPAARGTSTEEQPAI
jgi:pantothenate kinase